MKKNLEEQINEDLLTDYADQFKDYSLNQLQEELKKTTNEYKKAWDSGNYINDNGVIKVPGNRKIRELVTLINQRTFEVIAQIGIEKPETVSNNSGNSI